MAICDGIEIADLKYAFCDDWLIFATDLHGNWYYTNTEGWSAWLDLHNGADTEPNAVEDYMLPVAREQWEDLYWQRCEYPVPIPPGAEDDIWKSAHGLAP